MVGVGLPLEGRQSGRVTAETGTGWSLALTESRRDGGNLSPVTVSGPLLRINIGAGGVL